jgi:glucose-6-phosphate isomerase
MDNVTEHRAVLRVALRAPRGASIVVDGENVVPGVHAVLDRMPDPAGRHHDMLIRRYRKARHG